MALQSSQAASTSDTSSEVLFSRKGQWLEVVLNRPRALNALNDNMVHALLHELQSSILGQPRDSPNRAQGILLSGAGGKALCAGGDVKAVVQSAIDGDWHAAARFFRTEYTLDYLLARLSQGGPNHDATGPTPSRGPGGESASEQPSARGRGSISGNSCGPTQGLPAIPQVSLLDGIVMGGGVGLCINGMFRIATERTLFAMPETGIGLFTDVGASHFLPRLHPPGLGMLLALTGTQLRGADALRAGVATHYVASSDLPALIKSLQDLPSSGTPQPGICAATLNETLFKHSAAVPEDAGDFAQLERAAREHFWRKASVPEIISSLQSSQRDDADACQDMLDKLSRASPLSLHLTHSLLTRSESLPLSGAFGLEFRLASRCCKGPADFHEGVRCKLIDRGKTPSWLYGSVDAVPKDVVDDFFAPLDFCEELDLSGVDLAFDAGSQLDVSKL